MDDSEKFLLSREISANDGIVERGENQAVRQGASSREKEIGGDEVRVPRGYILVSYSGTCLLLCEEAGTCTRLHIQK